MPTWQLSAARSAEGGLRLRKPRLLTREIVQNALPLVLYLNVLGFSQHQTHVGNEVSPSMGPCERGRDPEPCFCGRHDQH